MTESFKYIKVLYMVGSPAITISEDWQSSFESVYKYWSMLDSLNYDMIFVESKQSEAKKMLEDWESTDPNCSGLKFDYIYKHGIEIHDNIKAVLRTFAKKHAQILLNEKKWTFEQWQDFMVYCSDTIYQWGKRYTELFRVYGYNTDFILDETEKINQHPDHIIKMFAQAIYCDEFFNIGTMKNNSNQWGLKAYDFIHNKKMCLGYGDIPKLWNEIVKTHPSVTGSRNAFRQPLAKQINRK